MNEETNGNATPFEGWAILELLGHRRLGGFVREVTLAGVGVLRIDTPGEGEEIVATQYYPPGSMYCLTPTTERMARAAAKASRVEPVTEWELKAIEAPRPRRRCDNCGDWEHPGESCHDGDDREDLDS